MNINQFHIKFSILKHLSWCILSDSSQDRLFCTCGQGKWNVTQGSPVKSLCGFFHYSLTLLFYPRWGFNMRCTHRPRALQGQRWTRLSRGRCLLCRIWRLETDWLHHRWTSSFICTLAKRCLAKPIPTWWASALTTTFNQKTVKSNFKFFFFCL